MKYILSLLLIFSINGCNSTIKKPSIIQPSKTLSYNEKLKIFKKQCPLLINREGLPTKDPRWTLKGRIKMRDGTQRQIFQFGMKDEYREYKIVSPAPDRTILSRHYWACRKVALFQVSKISQPEIGYYNIVLKNGFSYSVTPKDHKNLFSFYDPEKNVIMILSEGGLLFKYLGINKNQKTPREYTVEIEEIYELIID